MTEKQMNVIALLVAMFGMTAVWGQHAFAADSMSGMDHGSMENDSELPANADDMSGMDHSKMNHADKAQADDMQSMDHSASVGEKSISMQGGAAPADARDPHAYSDGYDFGPIPPPRMADQAYMGALLFNRLERARSRDNSLTMYDLTGKFGKDYDRLVLKAEGEVGGGKLQDSRAELLWGHALSTYWDTQIGLRYDSGVAPGRTWLALGVQGLAPYWFEVDATAYLGDQGRSALRLGAEYELLLTQKLILQPRVEASFYGQQDALRELGSGLSNLVTGIRLRYEIRREFAPYIGVGWGKKFAGTADYARTTGVPVNDTRAMAGLRFWF